MKILAILPARGGSKGILNKNIKLLGDKPLLAYTIEAAKKSKLLTKTILSSEDKTIISIGKKHGLEVPFIRPANLATDESPTILTVIHALKFYKEKGIVFDAVCLLQVTNPFRTGEFIDAAIEKFITAKSDSLVSVLEVPHEFNPNWVFTNNKEGNLIISTGESEIITRRQDLPKSFYRDGAIYITKSKVILEQHSLYGKSISYIKSDKNRHVNIDTMEDWKKAEKLIFKLGV